MKWATADTDQFDRTHVANTSSGAVELHTHGLNKGLAVDRLNVSNALTNAGDVRINSTDFTYRDNQGSPANHTLLALDIAKTITANDTFSGSVTFSGTVTMSGATLTLPANSVDTSQLVNSAVTTAKIADANVTTAKIADANVTRAKLAALAIASIMPFNSVASFTAGNTYYFGIGTEVAAGSEANVGIVMPTAGQLQNLYVAMPGSPGVGQTFVLTLRNNAADTALTVTVSGAGTTGSDNTHTVTVAAGDIVDVSLVCSAGASSVGGVRASMVLLV